MKLLKRKVGIREKFGEERDLGEGREEVVLSKDNGEVYFCPFVNRDSHSMDVYEDIPCWKPCGSWCPHFAYWKTKDPDENGRWVVALHCADPDRIISAEMA